jgi:phosphoglycolate phosphatase-like HAD superfamily hydrolase
VKYKLFAFDMDGTLVDSMPTLTDLAVDIISMSYRWNREKSREAYLRTVGHPFRRQLELIAPQSNLNDEMADMYAFWHQRLARTFERAPGLEDLFYDITKSHVWLGLVSSTSREIIDQMPQLPEFDYKGGFRPGFDKTRQLLEACEELEVTPDQVLMFGDTLADGDMAKRAGIDFVLTSVGTLSKDVIARLYVGT